MAKKLTARVASVEEKVAALVDRGCEIDFELKNLTVEEKGTKKIIGDVAGKLLQEGERSIKLEGNKAFASVVVVEKYELNIGHELFPLADRAIRAGVFKDAVTVTKSLAIAPEKIDEACEVLKAAGISAIVQVAYGIDSDGLREAVDARQSTEELQKSTDALKKCAVCKSVMRVSYEQKG